MNETAIDLIIKYYKEKDESILIENSNISKRDLNVIAIEILSWLKLEHKREICITEGKEIKLRPLLLNGEYTWCQNLKKLVESEEVFSNTFVIDNNYLIFAKHITEEDKKIARKKAYDEYRPVKRSLLSNL